MLAVDDELGLPLSLKRRADETAALRRLAEALSRRREIASGQVPDRSR